MIVLGVCGGHDANWCIVRDGVILGAFEKERFSRVRHDSGEVLSLIGKTLNYVGVQIAEIDLIATSEPVHKGTECGLRLLSGHKYRQPDEWVHQIVKLLDAIKPSVSIPHHLAHAAYARYTSRFEKTAVITWDGGGDFYTEDAYCSTSVSSWENGNLLWLERIENSDLGSLWFAYAKAIFGDGNASGKLMGLAALGNDSMSAAFSDRFVVPVRGPLQGAVTVKNCWPDYETPPFVPVGTSWMDPRSQNAAFAIQHLTNEVGLSLARKARVVTGQEYLALSGGVALNGYLNSKLHCETGFLDTFVPPAVNDGGLSVGCALFATHHIVGVPWCPGQRELAFLGMSYNEDEIAYALRSAGLNSRRLSLDEACEVAASLLAEGKIIAWYDGRSEHGPRALGARSILSLPCDVALKNRLNAQIKFREPFRPTAPIVLNEDVARFFDITWRSEYMMYIVGATPAAHRQIPAALHADGTARVQTVSPETGLGNLLRQVKRQLGFGVLLNTSFNVRAPIVETPLDAIKTFCQVPLDYMYIGGHLVERS